MHIDIDGNYCHTYCHNLMIFSLTQIKHKQSDLNIDNVKQLVLSYCKFLMKKNITNLSTNLFLISFVLAQRYTCLLWDAHKHHIIQSYFLSTFLYFIFQHIFHFSLPLPIMTCQYLISAAI